MDVAAPHRGSTPSLEVPSQSCASSFAAQSSQAAQREPFRHGEIAKTGDLTVSDLRVGDCYDLKDPTAEELDQVLARPCAEEHEFEMIFVGSMPAGPYPDAEGFLDCVDRNCLAVFETYIGRAYADSELDVYWLEPTPTSWSAGDRAVQCAAFHPRIHRLTGSLKGSDR